MSQANTFIHPDAKIGKNVTISPFAYIDKNVEIDDDSWIGPNACLWEGSRIGKNCKIYSGAQISCVPQDLKFEGEETLTFIGDNTSIREFVTISRGTSDRNETRIGSNCLLMAYVHIAHDCLLGDHCILSNSVQVAGHVTIGNYAVLGGTAAVRQFVRIGAHTMIAGGSLVRKDVPPFVSAAREPLAYSGVNAIGLKRRGFTIEKLNEIQEIYRTIFLSEFNTTRAVNKVTEEFPATPLRDEILDFIRNSERGIMKGME
ncbi:MAG: acyl-ACP--UDP-N-acetylglucosamine O-acyltransferase [Cyclobacteriaceae bacterium]|nr:acyl-ACP--UDP-N-acetylglucosamine O-acyltransferase [Cyclobacteriaceae bacterium]